MFFLFIARAGRSTGLIANIEMIVLFYSFLVLFQINGAIHTIRLALLLVVIFSVVMNIIDFISPAWSAVPGRAAGFYQNPNVAGLNMIMAMLASIPLLPRRLRLFFCIFVGLGVFLTFSRGAWLSWIIALGGLAAIGYLNIGRKNFSIIFISLVAGFVVFSALTGGLLDILMAFGIDEYLKPGRSPGLVVVEKHLQIPRMFQELKLPQKHCQCLPIIHGLVLDWLSIRTGKLVLTIHI